MTTKNKAKFLKSRIIELVDSRIEKRLRGQGFERQQELAQTLLFRCYHKDLKALCEYELTDGESAQRAQMEGIVEKCCSAAYFITAIMNDFDNRFATERTSSTPEF